jgi:hypothetical protein
VTAVVEVDDGEIFVAPSDEYRIGQARFGYHFLCYFHGRNLFLDCLTPFFSAGLATEPCLSPTQKPSFPDHVLVLEALVLCAIGSSRSTPPVIATDDVLHLDSYDPYDVILVLDEVLIPKEVEIAGVIQQENWSSVSETMAPLPPDSVLPYR